MNTKIPQHHLIKQRPPGLQETLQDELISEGKNANVGNARIRPPLEFASEVAKMGGSSLFAEEREANSKFNDQRTIGRNQQHTRKILGKIARLTELYQLLENQNDNTAQQKHLDDIDNLLSEGRNASADDFIAVAEGDPAVADTLLRMTLYEAQRQKNSEKAAAASAAIQELAQHAGQQINAGINTASAFAAFSMHPEHKQALRQLYYSTVINQQAADAIFDVLLDQFGGDGFQLALRTLQRALADDIAALAPSVSPTALRKILSGLDDTRAITNTLSVVEHFLDRLKNKYPQVTMPANTLTRSLLSMCRKGFYSRELTQLGIQVVGQQPLHQSLFFNGLLILIRKLPEKLWGDNGKNRRNALLMLRTLNDEYAVWEKKVTPQQNKLSRIDNAQ